MARISGLFFAALAIPALFLNVAWAAAPAANAQGIQSTIEYVRAHLDPESLVQLGRAEDAKLGLQQNCKAQYKATPVNLQVVSPLETAWGKADPVKGAWLVRYRLERCGEAKIYNALFVANGGKAPAARPFFPGSSNANPVLVNDAMRAALAQATAAGVPNGCKTAYVYDMQVATPARDVTEGGRMIKGVWDEVWTFSMCGELVDVPMTFTPDADGKGTSFRGSKGSLRRAAQ
jgi:hypothetical protein